MDYYTLIIMIIVPFCFCLAINVMVLMFVHSSTRRVATQIESSPPATRPKRAKMTHRDLHLFKHVMLMIWIFLLGWTPIYLIPVFFDETRVDPLLLRFFTLLTELSICSQVVDLFIYNRQLTRYLRTHLQRTFLSRQ